MRRLLIISLLIFTIFSSCKEAEKSNTAFANPSLGDEELDFLTAEIERDEDNDKLYFRRANRFYDLGRYDEAIMDLRVAISLDSMVPEYYHLLSDAFLDINNSNRALMTMEKAVELFPDRIQSRLKLSETLLILKQYDKAIEIINLIIRDDPSNAEAYFMLGVTFHEMGDKPRAINALRTAVENDADLVDGWLLLGNIMESLNNEEALRYYDIASRVAPNNVNVLHSKAYYLQNHDNIPEALKLYRTINKINPKYTDAYLNAGILYIELDSLEKAYEQFNLMVSFAPTNPRGYYYRGIANKLMGRNEGAAADFKNALNLDINYEEARNALAELNIKQ